MGQRSQEISFQKQNKTKKPARLNKIYSAKKPNMEERKKQGLIFTKIWMQTRVLN